MTFSPKIADRERLPELRLALPGTWGSVELSSEEAARASIRRLATRLTGRNDRAAPLRADLRKNLFELAEKAMAGGASELYLAIEIVPGLTVPLSLTVFWPPTPVIGSLPSKPDTLIDLVISALSSLPDSANYKNQLREDFGNTASWRRTKLLSNPADEGAPAYETLLVDYWLAVPGTQRVVLLTFSTSLLESTAQLLELFTVTIAAMRWVDPQPARASDSRVVLSGGPR